MIQAIDKVSVQRICSGQVVVDLATAVKELIENALDAGATIVEVKLRESGIDSIEVSDNGSGIDPQNYNGLALKHHTSKLKDFSDLTSVSSFGFRGEALNALCELSGKFSVTTRQIDSPVGTALAFDRNGACISQNIVARPLGTSILVENLFEVLPVRRGEFVRNIKKQFTKLIRVLQSYALIAVGCRLIVTNSTKGSKSTIVSTEAGGRLEDNIRSVFGNKFLTQLTAVNTIVDMISPTSGDVDASRGGSDPQVDDENGGNAATAADPSSIEGISNTETDLVANTQTLVQPASSCVSKQIVISGFVSKAGFGVGRSDNDRQFLFVNRRPVDLPKIIKVINEVWRRFEMKHKPALVLNLAVPAGYFDVNLSPDKREIVLANESAVLDALRDSIDTLYAPSRYTFQLSQGGLQTTLTTFNQRTEVPVATDPADPRIVVDAVHENSAMDVASTESVAVSRVDSEVSAAVGPVSVLADASVSGSVVWCTDQEQISMSRSMGKLLSPIASPKTARSPLNSARSCQPSPHSVDRAGTRNIGVKRSLPVETGNAESEEQVSAVSDKIPWHSQPSDVGDGSDRMESPLKQPKAHHSLSSSPLASAPALDDGSGQETVSPIIDLSNFEAKTTDSCPPDSGELVWSFDPAAVLCTLQAQRDMGLAPSSKAAVELTSSATPQPSDSSIERPLEERLLARVLNKRDFPSMRVIGQFNLGFIIGELRGDLFILDQHACDEKYRFETLQLSTTLHQQPLIAPLALECTWAEQEVIIGHMEVFERNGFKLRVEPLVAEGAHALSERNTDTPTEVHAPNEDAHAPSTVDTTTRDHAPIQGRINRIKLLAVPFSKSVQFGANDVHELASLLGSDSSDSYGGEHVLSKLVLKNDALKGAKSGENAATMDVAATDENVNNGSGSSATSTVRLPKVLSMFASRACRSAVMIGTALSQREMSIIVAKLAGIEQPWNCPHGRPTLRHLFDLAATIDR